MYLVHEFPVHGDRGVVLHTQVKELAAESGLVNLCLFNHILKLNGTAEDKKAEFSKNAAALTHPEGDAALTQDFKPAPNQVDYTAPMTREMERIMSRGCLKGYMIEAFRAAEADKIMLFILQAVPWISKYLMDNSYKFITFQSAVIAARALEKSRKTANIPHKGIVSELKERYTEIEDNEEEVEEEEAYLPYDDPPEESDDYDRVEAFGYRGRT